MQTQAVTFAGLGAADPNKVAAALAQIRPQLAAGVQLFDALADATVGLGLTPEEQKAVVEALNVPEPEPKPGIDKFKLLVGVGLVIFGVTAIGVLLHRPRRVELTGGSGGERRIRLSTAQIAALESRGLEMPEGEAEEALAAAWRGGTLVVTPATRELLFEALTDASNAEDAQAEQYPDDREVAGPARRASRALATVALKVLKAGAE